MWKLYFWLYVVGSIFGVSQYYTGRISALADIIELATFAVIGLGLYAYAYGRPMFSKAFWKVVFYYMVAGIVLEILYKYTEFNIYRDVLESNAVLGQSDLLITTILVLPAFYAIWRLTKSGASAKARKN